MGENNCYGKFFGHLPERFKDENDLSDMLWALLKVSPCLKKRLFKHFTEVDVDDASTIEVSREPCLDGGGRLDLLLVAHGEALLAIENKLLDQNYHFDKYPSEVHKIAVQEGIRPCNVKLLLVANHELTSRDKAKANDNKWLPPLKWETLLAELPKWAGKDSEIVSNFITYAKEVCTMPKPPQNPVRIDTAALGSLNDFGRMLVSVLRDKYEYRDKAALFDQHGTVSYFGVEFWIERLANLKAWIGIIYCDAEPKICIAVPKTCKFSNNTSNDDLFTIEPNREEVEFILKPGFFSMNNTEQQEKQLREFVSKATSLLQPNGIT